MKTTIPLTLWGPFESSSRSLRWCRELKTMKLRYALLLGAILSWMVMLPFIDGDFLGVSIPHLMGIITVVFAIAATTETRNAVYLAIACGSVSLALNAQHSGYLRETSIALDIGLLAFASYCILGFVFSGRIVTSETLRAAVCLYLFLGIGFACAYYLGSLAIPNAVLHDNAPARKMSEMIYLSFATLTTLGYGDIRPNISVLRSLAILEGISGQLFLTLLVARLVGLHITAQSPAAGSRH
jgi:voltage-gated potassium channel